MIPDSCSEGGGSQEKGVQTDAVVSRQRSSSIDESESVQSSGVRPAPPRGIEEA